MGLNNEYSYDAFQGEDAYEEEYQEDNTIDLDDESWQDWHSEHLLNMWMSLRQYIEENGISSTVMTRATFPAFVQFVQRNS
jgi:hypothetical protein